MSTFVRKWSGVIFIEIRNEKLLKKANPCFLCAWQVDWIRPFTCFYLKSSEAIALNRFFLRPVRFSFQWHWIARFNESEFIDIKNSKSDAVESNKNNFQFMNILLMKKHRNQQIMWKFQIGCIFRLLSWMFIFIGENFGVWTLSKWCCGFCSFGHCSLYTSDEWSFLSKVTNLNFPLVGRLITRVTLS